MRNPLIGVILNTLLDAFNKGLCDDLPDDSVEEFTNSISSIYNKLADKQDIVMTVEEARRYLSCTRQTLNNYVREGKLVPKKHLGGVLEFKYEDLKNFKNNKLKRKEI